MANLTFRTIKQGIVKFGVRVAGRGNQDNRFEWSSRPFDLSGLVNLPALLLLEVEGANWDKHFITINADQDVANIAPTGEAENVLDATYVGNIHPQKASSVWALQVHRIPSSDVLMEEGNVLGIQHRLEDGSLWEEGNADEFNVRSIFLLYFGSQEVRG